MATSYTGLRVQDTYNAIIKIGDNSNLTATPKLLSDGLGNDSPLYLSGTRLGIGISPAYQFHTSGNAKIGGDVIISGDLTVNGDLTYLNVTDLAVEDPLIKLAKDNTANTLDIGLFGKYVATGTKYKGFFNDASDDKFKLFIGTTVEPTTTVDTSASGYTVGTLVANLEGNVTGGTISGTTGTFSGLLKADTLTLTSGNDDLTFTQSSDDWTINNEQQNNGITIYDGTGGIDIKYAGTSYLDIDVNGVSVAGNIDFSVDTNLIYADAANNLVGIGKTPSTYKLDVNGKIASNDYIIAGLGNRGVALTHNDGYGNANVTFNHVSGTPEGDGNSFRIECNTDSSTNPAMIFELVAGVTSGVAVSTVEKMRLDETGVKVRDTAGGIIHLERNDTSIVDGNPLGRLRFTGDDPTDGTFNFGAEIRAQAAGTWSTDNYPTRLQFYTATTDTLNLALTLDESQNSEFKGDITISKNDPKLTFLDSTVNTDPSGQILFSELSGHRNFDINYNGTDDRLEFRGKVVTEDTDLMYINRDSTDTVQIIGGLRVNGTIKDSSGDAGTSGQILSSTGTGTNWVDNEADSAKRLTVDVKNVHGATLAKGTVVHAEPTGTLSGNVIEVVAADANSGRMPAIGVLNEALLDDAEGKAVMFGTVQGIDTSAFSVGDELYVSTTAGAFTNTKPTATTEEVQKIAIVIKSHASNGLIKVFGAGRANDVPNLLTRNISIDGADFHFGNADQVRMGGTLSSPGLRIQHNGTNSYIDGEIGDMYFRAEANDSDMYFQADSGAGGNITYFRLDGGLATHDGTNTTQTVTVFPDNSKIQLGGDANGDLRLFHNGTNSFIANNTGNIEIINYSDDKDIIFKSDDGGGAVAEYFRVDGSEQRVVYGRSAQMADNVSLFFGNGDDTFIKYDTTALKTLFVGDTDFTGIFIMKKTSTAAQQTLLKLHNTGENGSQQDLILSNTYDRDVGIKFQTLGGYHHLWQDSNGDDSLIISAAGIAGDDITIEFYQNHNVEIPNGNLTISGGDLVLDDGTTESPHIILVDDDDVEFRIYNADSNTFHITRSDNSGADFVINANASDYTQSTFSFAGATLSAATIGNWNTAYNDHIAGISFNTSDGILTLTQKDGGTLTQDLDNRYPVFRGNVLTLSNGEITDLSAAYQMAFDANDVGTDITTLGDFSGGYPFGIYILGDGGNTGTTLGTGLVKVWNTGHFAKQNILDWETAYDDKINSASFETTDGVLTLTRQDTGTVTVDLDGRYLELGGGTLTGNLEIENSGTPTLTLDDTGNAGGGGASGIIIYKNTAGNAIGLGYTADDTTSSDFIISTDSSSTYGGYLGLDAAAISDPSQIILDPKTDVYSTKPVRTANVFIANDIDVTNATPSTDELRVSGYGIIGSRAASVYITNADTSGAVQIGNGTSHNADPTALFSASTITHKRDTIINGDLTLTKAQITTNIGTTSHLYISPDSTTDTTGKTSIFLGTSTVDNYGISLRGARLGTSGTPTFELAVHNNSANGSVALEIDQFLGTHIKGELFIDDVDNISSTAQADKFLVMDTGDSEVRYATSSQLASAINANTGVGGAGLIPIYETTNTFTTNSNLYWDIANGRLGLGDFTPSYRLDLVTGTTDTAQYSMRISHSRNNPDTNSSGLFIQGIYEGTKSAATDVVQRGLHVDVDSSATGTATDEHRLYGIHSDTRNSGFADVVYGTYSYAESNYTGAKTAALAGVYGIATHDSSSANGGVSNMYGTRGLAQVQDDGDVDNAYGIHGLVSIANNRDAGVGATHGLYGEIQIDEQTAISYSTMYGCRTVIDNNQGDQPTFGNQYLFFGDYQGTRGGSAYGIYCDGDRHYLEGLVSIGNNNINGGIPLNVYHATNSQIRFTTDGTGTESNDGFRVGYNGTYGQLFLYENANIRIATNNTPFAYFTSDQRLGLNIENATHTLHAYHATTNVIGKFQSGDNQAWISVRDDGYTSYGALFGCDHDAGHTIVLADDSVTKRLVVNNSGQVGIGFDTFSSKLSVNGNIYTSGHLLVDTYNDQYRIGEDTYTSDLTEGVMVRPSDEANPASGMSMFTVRSGGGSPRLFVEHDGTTGTSNNEFTIGALSNRANGNILLRTLATSYFSNNIKVGATGDTSARLEIQKAQITTNYDTTSFLRLHPSATTNNGGYTNMFFGSSTVDNYGISMGADRFGTSGQANFVIRNHENSAVGNMVFKVDLAGNVIVSGQTVNHIKTDTSDGSDNKGMVIDSAGGDGSSSRGAYISMYGNEHASLAGDMYITAGNTSLAELRLNAVASDGFVTSYAGGSIRHKITSTVTTINNYTQVNNTIATENGMGTAGEWDGARIRVEATNTVDTTGFSGIRFATSTANNYGWSMGANRVSNGLGDFRIYEHQGVSTGFHRITIQKTTGYLGVKDSTPSYHIDVNGTIRATGDVIAYSDRRVKDNIETIENGLEKVTKLRGVSYTRNDIEDDTTKIGVIAQEVLEVLPEVVKQDDRGKYSVSYGNMAGLFIEAIKDLKAEINELKEEIKELKSK